MKKIIVTILALACGVCAYSKTVEEMMSEIPAYQADASTRGARLAYMEANKADIIAAFNEWKTTDIAKFYPNEGANKSLTDAQKENAIKLRSFFCGVYWIYGAELEVPDNTALRMASERFAKTISAEKYAAIKSAGFKIDGVEISNVSKFILAVYKNDSEYIFANDALLDNIDAKGLSYLAPYIKKTILSADIEKAKAFCNAFEKAMLIKGCTDNVDSIKAVGKYLTERILDAKITK